MNHPLLRFSRSFLILFFFCVGFMPAAASGQEPSGGADSWKHWTKSQRTAYVLGFSEGYSDAQLRLCTQIQLRETSPQRTASTFSDCDAEHGRPFDVVQAVADVTVFYSRYQDSKGVEPSDILQELVRGMTLEEVHKTFQQRFRQLK